MAFHNTSRHSSLTSLTDEIRGIYTSYASKNRGDGSRDSLDSAENESAVHLHPGSLSIPPSHEFGTALSGTETPQSTSSFDFTVHDHQNQVTNSSLNVLLDSTEDSKDEFVSSVSLVDSKRSLDPSALKNGQSATEESLGSYKNYDERINDSDWVERGAATTSVSTPTSTTIIRRTVEDFEFGKDLGEGSYSTVVLAKDKVTGVSYAVKILDKRHIIKEKKVKYVNIEKHALNRLNQTQGIISLFFTFQDRDSLYFVLDYAANGELLGLIKKYGTLNEACTRYLAAQILDAINHMHINGVIHRDIKPENILLDDKCRIRITDFGTAKLLERKKNGDTGAEEDYPLDVRAKSFVGTAEYVSPELLENKYCGKPGDLWAFGCILYQMIAGKPPFKATNEYLTFQKITKLQYAFSAGFPLILRDLIKQILVLQPSRRATIDQIQDHYFFNECDFDDSESIWNSDIPELSPYKMNAQSMMKMPTTQQPKKSVIKKITRKPQTQNGNSNRNTTEKNGSKSYSAASVAAYVLGKDEEVPDAKPKTPKTPKTATKTKKSTNTVSSTPDYIPGTNILRPQINKMSTYSIASTTSSKSNKGSLKEDASKVLEVTPPTAVEAAWRQFLGASERVLNVGSATVRKLPTEVFEKKNKGYIHDAPLGMSNKLQSSGTRGSSRSMLSHVVQGNRMRDIQEPPTDAKVYDENDAITYHQDEIPIEHVSTKEDEEEDNKSISVATNSARLGRSLFKKLLPNSTKKEDASNSQPGSGSSETTERRPSSTMDKVRSYTVIVTTFGRVLLFLRDDHKTDYKLICEISLDFPFVQLKEVVSNSSSKFGKMIPSTGIFAIVVSKSTFVFETEKYEVDQWVDALAKGKLNQYERQRESEQKQFAKERSVSSPKLLDSPAFSTPSQRQSPRQGSPAESREIQHVQHKSSESPVLESRDGRIFSKNNRPQQSAKTNRKAPPSLPTSPVLSASGLIRGHDAGSETIHAAQLAVLNSPIRSSSEHRRSSFSRDRNGPSIGYVAASGSNGGAKVTSMNSKFLARSRGKK